MGRDREPEGGPRALGNGQASLDDLPRGVSPRAPVHASVILLVHDGRVLRVPDHLVDARAEVLSVVDLLLPVPADPGIVHGPGFACVLRREDARRRDADQHALGIAGVREDCVKAQTAAAGFPLVAARAVVQAVVRRPRGAVVLAPEQSRRLDADVQVVLGPFLELPKFRHTDPRLLGEPRAFLRDGPLCPKVGAASHDGTPVLARHPREHGLPVVRIQDRVTDRVAFEVRTPRRPPLPIP